MIDTQTALVVAGTFFLAGGVKGIIGLGLPTVSLGVLAAALDLTTAMTMLLIPAIVTNIWQAAVGGNGKVILQRIWFFLSLATVTIWIGSFVLASVNPLYLSILLGLLLVLYSSLDFVGISFSISPQHEKWAGPIFGAVNGLLTGMTGSSVVPGVMYLQAIGLSREMLIQAMGMLFSLSTISLAFALRKNNLLTAEHVVLSAFAVIPTITGMMIGQRIRKFLSELRFRKIFFVSIFVLGLFIIAKAGLTLY